MPAPAVRDADPSDFPLLLKWRNDPVTRAMSRRTHEMTAEEFQPEILAKIANPAKRLFIADIEGIPCGTVLLERDDEGRWEVSITLDPEVRGRGFAVAILTEALNETFPDGWPVLIAEIKPDNLASRRLFERFGFRRVGERDECLVYERSAP